MTAGASKGRPPRVVLVSVYGIENRGVRYISAVLRNNGFEPHLVLMKRWVNNQIEPPTPREMDLLAEHVAKLDPVLVGFGFGAPYLGIVTRLTARVRESSKAAILWGGVHPTVCPEDCIPHADAVCVGEGEFPTLDLCRALVSGGDPSAIPNLWWREGERVTRNEPRPLNQDLDALPLPDYCRPGTVFIEDDRVREEDPLVGTAEYRIYPTRGCPYACTYCHNSVLRAIFKGRGKYYRTRGVESVVGELEEARRVFPRIRRVKFDGDVFAFPPAWISEFAREYKARVGLPFELLTYPGELSEDALVTLRKAGLKKIQTGIQSGSDEEVSTVYGRGSTADQIRALSRTAHRAKVEVVYDLIFDNPLAAPDDKRAVVELLLTLDRPFLVYLYSLTVFPRTALAETMLAKGLITPEDVEGRATKSFRQFRLSLDWPRPPEDVFWISLTILAAKRFIPKALVRGAMDSAWLKRHPWPLKLLARAADVVKAGWIALEMLRHGELTRFKLRQYGSLRKVISQ